MLLNNQPSNEIVRELYAQFGLAYYNSECLHRGLCIILATCDLPSRDLITRPRMEEKLTHAFSLTLGEIVRELNGKLPDEYIIELNQVINARNYLAHHFWFERSHLMHNSDNIRYLINELDRYSKLFCRLDDKITQLFESKQSELGLTDDLINKHMLKILSGYPEDNLPEKNITRELKKKLKRKQRLIRVWEFSLPKDGKPLIFETDDGYFWQLCDIGLGWTRYEHVEPNWVEHPIIKPYLPANINPRPKDAKPWNYEFKLSNEAFLWVKPGKQKGTFQWGIKINNLIK